MSPMLERKGVHCFAVQNGEKPKKRGRPLGCISKIKKDVKIPFINPDGTKRGRGRPRKIDHAAVKVGNLKKILKEESWKPKAGYGSGREFINGENVKVNIPGFPKLKQLYVLISPTDIKTEHVVVKKKGPGRPRKLPNVERPPGGGSQSKDLPTSPVTKWGRWNTEVASQKRPSYDQAVQHENQEEEKPHVGAVKELPGTKAYKKTMKIKHLKAVKLAKLKKDKKEKKTWKTKKSNGLGPSTSKNGSAVILQKKGRGRPKKIPDGERKPGQESQATNLPPRDVPKETSWGIEVEMTDEEPIHDQTQYQNWEEQQAHVRMEEPEVDKESVTHWVVDDPSPSFSQPVYAETPTIEQHEFQEDLLHSLADFRFQLTRELAAMRLEMREGAELVRGAIAGVSSEICRLRLLLQPLVTMLTASNILRPQENLSVVNSILHPQENIQLVNPLLRPQQDTPPSDSLGSPHEDTPSDSSIVCPDMATTDAHSDVHLQRSHSHASLNDSSETSPATIPDCPQQESTSSETSLGSTQQLRIQNNCLGRPDRKATSEEPKDPEDVTSEDSLKNDFSIPPKEATYENCLGCSQQDYALNTFEDTNHDNSCNSPEKETSLNNSVAQLDTTLDFSSASPQVDLLPISVPCRSQEETAPSPLLATQEQDNTYDDSLCVVQMDTTPGNQDNRQPNNNYNQGSPHNHSKVPLSPVVFVIQPTLT
ncbi:uncharacterized protein LOC128667018 isoform X2 [Bombina bombina]|uniref:uncharacterized protein LOC128667018 isoform X2 n=1 Tax=Bombina bombina TaxID=8345 RepID=UPI00235B01D0|nr:uncharacterized protein LOC128667018 isoform X2 [Bombina bombina]